MEDILEVDSEGLVTVRVVYVCLCRREVEVEVVSMCRVYEM